MNLVGRLRHAKEAELTQLRERAARADAAEKRCSRFVEIFAEIEEGRLRKNPDDEEHIDAIVESMMRFQRRAALCGELAEALRELVALAKFDGLCK